MLRNQPATSSNIAARRRPRTLGRLGLIVAVALVASVVTPFVNGTAFASTLDQKRAEARQIAAQIDANDTKIELLSEQYNGTILKIASLSHRIVNARADLRAAQKHADGLKSQVRQRAAALYMGARSGSLFPELDARNAQEVATRSSYTAAAAARDSTLLSELRSASAQLDGRQKDLQKAIDRTQAERDQLAATREQYNNLNTQQHQLLTKVNGEIGTLVKQAQEAAAAAARAAAEAAMQRRIAAARQSQHSSSGGYTAPVNLPPPSGNAAIAVQAAEAQLNKPYQFAAAGPGTFDCSGLTMYAWAKAGVYMPHFAATQYTIFPHVPINDLKPGDLVFYGSPIHHVGMFVGNGTMIEAPHTGDFVKYSTIYRPDFAGASRPG